MPGKVESPASVSTDAVVACGFWWWPISTTPRGETQLIWPLLGVASVWVLVQLLPNKATHEVSTLTLLSPPQMMPKLWEWSFLASGRLGREHSLEPLMDSNSTELGWAEPVFPPVTITTEIMFIVYKHRAYVMHGWLARTKKSLKNLFLEKIIIPPRKSIPFNVIKRVQ